MTENAFNYPNFTYQKYKIDNMSIQFKREEANT